jgi:hypothetical protein
MSPQVLPPTTLSRVLLAGAPEGRAIEPRQLPSLEGREVTTVERVGRVRRRSADRKQGGGPVHRNGDQIGRPPRGHTPRPVRDGRDPDSPLTQRSFPIAHRPIVGVPLASIIARKHDQGVALEPSVLQCAHEEGATVGVSPHEPPGGGIGNSSERSACGSIRGPLPGPVRSRVVQGEVEGSSVAAADILNRALSQQVRHVRGPYLRHDGLLEEFHGRAWFRCEGMCRPEVERASNHASVLDQLSTPNQKEDQADAGSQRGQKRCPETGAEQPQIQKPQAQGDTERSESGPGRAVRACSQRADREETRKVSANEGTPQVSLVRSQTRLPRCGWRHCLRSSVRSSSVREDIPSGSIYQVHSPRRRDGVSQEAPRPP